MIPRALFLVVLLAMPLAGHAEYRLNSTEPRCLGPAVFVFGNYTYAQNGILYFHKTQFHQGDVRFDETQLLPWMRKIANYPSLKKALTLIQRQYVDLAERLRKTAQARTEILRDYGADSDVSDFDGDERNLSAMGMKLSKLSQSFIAGLKPTLRKLDIARKRGETLRGLNSFDISLDKIEQDVTVSMNKPNVSNQESIRVMESVVRELEKALRELEQATGR